MPLELLAPDVWRISLMPRDGINAYVIGDVLVDAGTKFHAKRILRELQGHAITTHALTHAHYDHAGGTKAVATALGVPVWCGVADEEAVTTGKGVTSASIPNALSFAANFPACPVAKTLREGDPLAAGFVTLDAPGHSPGQVVFWRESDRVLIGGDVFFNMNIFTTKPGLQMPINLFTVDPAQNRESARKLAALNPAVAGFGHGPILRDPAALQACVDQLPR